MFQQKNLIFNFFNPEIMIEIEYHVYYDILSSFILQFK